MNGIKNVFTMFADVNIYQLEREILKERFDSYFFFFFTNFFIFSYFSLFSDEIITQPLIEKQFCHRHASQTMKPYLTKKLRSKSNTIRFRVNVVLQQLPIVGALSLVHPALEDEEVGPLVPGRKKPQLLPAPNSRLKTRTQ